MRTSDHSTDLLFGRGYDAATGRLLLERQRSAKAPFGASRRSSKAVPATASLAMISALGLMTVLLVAAILGASPARSESSAIGVASVNIVAAGGFSGAPAGPIYAQTDTAVQAHAGTYTLRDADLAFQIILPVAASTPAGHARLASERDAACGCFTVTAVLAPVGDMDASGRRTVYGEYDLLVAFE